MADIIRRYRVTVVLNHCNTAMYTHIKARSRLTAESKVKTLSRTGLWCGQSGDKSFVPPQSICYLSLKEVL